MAGKRVPFGVCECSCKHCQLGSHLAPKADEGGTVQHAHELYCNMPKP